MHYKEAFRMNVEILGHSLKRKYDIRLFRYFSKCRLINRFVFRQYDCLKCKLYIVCDNKNNFYCLDTENYDFIKCEITCDEIIIKRLLE